MRMILIFILLFSLSACSSWVKTRQLAMNNPRIPSGNSDLIKEQAQDVQTQQANQVITEYKFNENFDESSIADVSLTQLAPNYMEPMDIDGQVGLDNASPLQNNDQTTLVQEVKLDQVQGNDNASDSYKKLSNIPKKKTSATSQKKTISNKKQQLKKLEHKSGNMSKTVVSKSRNTQNTSVSISRPSKEEIEAKLKQLQSKGASGSVVVKDKLLPVIRKTETSNAAIKTQDGGVMPQLKASSNSDATSNVKSDLTTNNKVSVAVPNNTVVKSGLTSTAPVVASTKSAKVGNGLNDSTPPAIPSIKLSTLPVTTKSTQSIIAVPSNSKVNAVSPSGSVNVQAQVAAPITIPSGSTNVQAQVVAPVTTPSGSVNVPAQVVALVTTPSGSINVPAQVVAPITTPSGSINVPAQVAAPAATSSGDDVATAGQSGSLPKTNKDQLEANSDSMPPMPVPPTSMPVPPTSMPVPPIPSM